MISFRARRRQVVRKERCDQIRHEIREQVAFLARCEAGDPEALRQAEDDRRMPALAFPEPVEADYPDPDESEAVQPDPEPRHLRRSGESARRYHRRTGRPNLAERRAARLLARGYWDANCPLPGAIREALCALSMSPRELRRLLVAVWGREGSRLREPLPYWAPALRELSTRTGSGPRKVARWLEVCLHTGPPARVAALEAPVISP